MVLHMHLALAAYLPFAGPDMRFVYGLFAAILAIGAAMGVFRLMAKYKESRQVQRSSWKTFEKVAKVKGLTRHEVQLLTDVVRRSRIKRPTQVLSSITTYDRLVDEAIDRGWLIDDDAAHLESARVRIVRTSQVWDGTNRRQFERAEIAFEVLIAAVTKDAIDEELKTSYSETDAKFVQALEGLLAEARTESTRIQDLSAGGVLVLAGDKDQFHEGDYISFAQGVDEPPFDMSSLRGRILEVDKMEDQRQLQLHITFLPYDTDLRKEIIQIVYEAVERAAAEKRERKALVPKKKKAKTKTKAKAKAAKKAAAKKKAPVSEKAE